jgi:hypothetical protein
MMWVAMSSSVIEREAPLSGEGSLADLFFAANRELAQSDARLYRSADRHLKKVREILHSVDDTSKVELVPLLPEPKSIGIEPSFHRQTRQSLQELCRNYGVVGFHRLTKQEMIDQLMSKGVPTPPVPLEALTKKELIQLLRLRKSG